MTLFCIGPHVLNVLLGHRMLQPRVGGGGSLRLSGRGGDVLFSLVLLGHPRGPPYVAAQGERSFRHLSFRRYKSIAPYTGMSYKMRKIATFFNKILHFVIFLTGHHDGVQSGLWACDVIYTASITRSDRLCRPYPTPPPPPPTPPL